jgi:phage tail sheath gpL-like
VAYSPSTRSVVVVSAENAQSRVSSGFVSRLVIIAPGSSGTLTLWDADGTEAQQETATVTGTVTGAGDVDVIVTAVGMGNSPKTISVAVLEDDTAAVVAGKIRADLQADVDVSAFFAVSGEANKVVLTALVAAETDGTMNIDIDLAGSTATGIDDAPTSALTVGGFGEQDETLLLSKGQAALTAGDSFDLSAPLLRGIRHQNTTGGKFYLVHSEY